MVEIPAPQYKEPLHRLVEAMQITDAEMTQVLRSTARESELIIKKLEGKGGIGARVRRAQLELAQLQARMWRTVGDQTRVAIGDGVDAAAESAVFLDEVLLNSVGGSSTYWRQSVLQQARQGIPNLISRRENGIGLSERVYRNAALSSGRIDRILDGMIVSGANAREIAARVKGFISPDTPGGSSYAAMRLGRTELNNAFHTTSRRIGEATPWVIGQKWNLSGSHPKPDLCDDYASHGSKLGRGVFDPGDVPNKPHPQCLCYITPVTPSREEFINNFTSGQYDSYIDGQMGCRSA